MKTIDMRFDEAQIELLNNLVHQKVHTLIFDPMQYLEVPRMDVFLETDDGFIKLTNQRATVDYFGEETSMAVMGMSVVNETNNDPHEEYYRVNHEVVQVDVVDEVQRLMDGDKCLYEVHLTRAIIIYFDDGLELSLEKHCVPYSEAIVVDEGQRLLEIIDIPEYFFNHFETAEPVCRRAVINLLGY